MGAHELKYPRRNARTITGQRFILSEPEEVVSHKMSKIPSKGTSIENIIAEFLTRNKLHFSAPELIIEKIQGNPDFVLPRFRIAIFCDGDFWHGKKFKKGAIKNNQSFWDAKIESNILRDETNNSLLKGSDWKVFRFWESEIKADPQKCIDKILDYIDIHYSSTKHSFTFVDLFAGIGGFRIALEELGGLCLGFSEVDRQCVSIYKRNFFGFKNSKEVELGDLTKLSKLPFDNVDLIVGGVPCQAWSVAGKNLGFDDPRGKLWLDTIRIIRNNQPKVFILENVKGLMDPRNRKNLELIISELTYCGYDVHHPRLLNSYDFGLPQNRDRIFIIGFRKDLKSFSNEFYYPKPIDKKIALSEIIEGMEGGYFEKRTIDPSILFGEKIPISRNRFQRIDQLNDFFIFSDTRNGHTTIHSWDLTKTTDREKKLCLLILKNRRKKKYGPSDGNPIMFSDLQKLDPEIKKSELKQLVSKGILKEIDARGYEFVNSKNSSGINGVYRVFLPQSTIFSTLTATGTKDFVSLKSIDATTPEEFKIKFIEQVIRSKRYRQITAKEAGKLQGFPNWFSIHENEKVAKRQFGNAVSTTVVYYLAKQISKTGIFHSK